MNALSDNVRGAALMMLAMAGFVFNDMGMKLVSENLSLFQAIFLRGLFTTVLLGIVVWQRKAYVFECGPGDRKIMALRVAGEVGATLCYLTALFNMPIANATAILQALPLAVTLGAALFLGEQVGWRRYLAICIGFTGILIIVRPGAEGFNAYSFWALAAVLFVVLRDLATNRLSAKVPSFFVALLTSVALTVAGAVLAPTMSWNPVAVVDLALLAMTAVFLIFGYLFIIMAMRVGEISFVSPFRYTILIWAIVIGVVVFGDIPDGWTLGGSFIVVAMGIYTFYRENRARKRARKAGALLPNRGEGNTPAVPR